MTIVTIESIKSPNCRLVYGRPYAKISTKAAPAVSLAIILLLLPLLPLDTPLHTCDDH